MKRIGRSFALFLSFLHLALFVYGQQTVRGVVRESKTGQVISDVYVMLSSADGKSLYTCSFSDDQGDYSLVVPSSDDTHFLVSTSRIGYKPFRLKIDRHADRLDIVLIEQPIALREVMVKSLPITQRGDTIHYFMSSFVRPQDRSLADVLSRMPDIEVSVAGSIKYQGKPINRFYIEDMDLLEDRYSLATHNLSPDDIASVQVYEQHEPIKSLRSRSESEQAAINIKLKDKVRAKWMKTLSVGVGGVPLLYDGTLTAARFSKRHQTLAIVKGNNSGKKIFDELTRHQLKSGSVVHQERSDGVPDRIRTVSSKGHPLLRDRARFNESGIASMNQLFRVADEVDLRLNMNYGFEKERRDRAITKEYLFDNQASIVISDRNDQTIKWHKLEGDIGFTANKSNYFFVEKVRVDIHKKEASSSLSMHDRSLEEAIHIPRMRIQNVLKYTRLLGVFTLELINNTTYEHLPQSLLVNSSKELPLFNHQSFMQTVDVTAKNNLSYLDLSYKRKKWWCKIKGGVEIDQHKLESFVSPEMGETFSDRNHLLGHQMRIFVEPRWRFEHKKMMLTADLSTNMLISGMQEISKRSFFLNPRIAARYDFNSRLKSSVSYGRTLSYGSIAELYGGYILSSYNTLDKGFDRLAEKATQNMGYSVLYKDIPKLFSLHLLGTYLIVDKSHMRSNVIQGFYTMTSEEQQANQEHLWINKLLLSKMITSLSLTTSLELSHNMIRSSMLQQKQLFEYRSHTFSIVPTLQWQPSSKMNLEYTLNYRLTENRRKEAVTQHLLSSCNQHFSAVYAFSKSFLLSTSFQYFYSAPPQKSTINLLFWDLGLQYKMERSTVRVDWTNVLNQRQLMDVSYQTINRVTVIDAMRPSEFMISYNFFL